MNWNDLFIAKIERPDTLGFATNSIWNETFEGSRNPDILNPPMEREVKVVNKLGLHARPAAEFVRAARAFEAIVTIRKDGECYSAASILDVLTAGLECGMAMTLDADGPDAEEALDKLSALLHEFKRQEES